MKNYKKIFGAFIIIFSLIIFLKPVSANAATLCNTAIDTGFSSGWYNRMYLSQVLVNSGNAGYVNSGSLYITGSSVSTTVYVAIYSDHSGSPSILLGVSNGVTIASNQAAGWVNFTFSSPIQVTSGTNYWIGYYSDGTGTSPVSGGPHSVLSNSAVGDYTSANGYYLTVGDAPVPSTITSSTNYGSPLNYSIYVNTYNVPTVTSPTNTSITTATATLGGNVTSDGGTTITDRGVCVGTSANPSLGGTCFSTSGTTGVFTVNATGLTGNITYHYRAYATNSVGTSYTSDDTFTTLSTLPTGVTTNAATSVNSYYVTLNGSGNPNSYATTGHFRIYTSNPSNCTSDSGGSRVPALSTDDISLGSDSSSHNFSYTTTLGEPFYLTPQTQYWYCAYGVNTNGTTGGSSTQTFTTPDGPANPCDAPTTGNLVIPAGASCSFPGDTYDGISSTASITFSSGSVLTANPGQNIGRGSSMVFDGGTLTLGGGVMARGGVYIKDADGDGVIDADADTYGYVGTTPPSGYVQRSTISNSYAYSKKVLNISTFDCNSSNGNVYQNVSSLVTDADHDGYQTSATASTQCVGAAASFNGRTYYKDTSGNYTWLPSSAVLGGGITDCNDSDATPCVPSITNETATSITNTTAVLGGTFSYYGTTGFSNNYYFKYGTTNTGSCSTLASSTSTTSFATDGTYTKSISGLTYNTTYYYCGVAANSNGTGYGSITSFTTTNVCYRDADGDGYGNANITANCGTSGYVTDNTDCYDANSNAYPGQTKYFTVQRGDTSYDYNCDGVATANTFSYCPNGHAGNYYGFYTGTGTCSATPGCNQSVLTVSSNSTCGSSVTGTKVDQGGVNIYSNSSCTTQISTGSLVNTTAISNPITCH
jgi:hypothetical protein